MAKNKPEAKRSNILRFQPVVTKAIRKGCIEDNHPRKPDPMAQEGLRLSKAFFAVEDAALRGLLLTMLENIATGTRTRGKRGRR